MGVRDTARVGSPEQLKTALRESISEVRAQAAWRAALTQIGISATALKATETEEALLTGLRCILVRSLQGT